MAAETTDQFFKNLCAHTGLAVIATDEELRIRFWNAAASGVFGGSAETMLGQPIVSVVPSAQRSTVQRLLERALSKGEGRQFEFWHTDPQGRGLYLAVTLSPVIDDAAHIVGISVCVRDMTRGMELVRDVAETQRMSALSSMAGALAHHLNNLLGGTITAIDFAQSGDDPQRLRRAVRATAAALTRATELTHKLLIFAEGDRTEGPVGELRETIEQFIRDHQAAWADRNIGVETELPALTVPVPTRAITMVLDILSTNACEAMPDGGTLRFELARADDGHILLQVQDTGVGAHPEHLHHAFEPFFTTKRAATPDLPAHLGLGLSVVHGIVKDLGGQVKLEARPGRLTVCSICLPVSCGNR